MVGNGSHAVTVGARLSLFETWGGVHVEDHSVLGVLLGSIGVPQSWKAIKISGGLER